MAVDPANSGWQRDRAVYYERLGDLAVAQGSRDTAAQYFGEGLAIFRRLGTVDPSNTDWQSGLEVFYSKLNHLREAN